MRGLILQGLARADGPRGATVDFSASRAPGVLGSGLPTLVYHGRIPVLWGAGGGRVPAPVTRPSARCSRGQGRTCPPPRPS